MPVKPRALQRAPEMRGLGRSTYAPLPGAEAKPAATRKHDEIIRRILEEPIV
jgi:hypothetical protein